MQLPAWPAAARGPLPPTPAPRARVPGQSGPAATGSWRSKATNSATQPWRNTLTSRRRVARRVRGRSGHNAVTSSKRAGGNRLVRCPAHTEQPQRRDGHGQPQPRRPVRVAHARAVPLPAGPLGDFKALFDPGPQAIPARITGLRRPDRSGSARGPCSRLPTAPAGCRPPGSGFKGDARAAPTRARPGHKAQQGAPARAPGGPKAAARVDAQKRMPAQA